jgi:hypothetical protein
MINPTTLSKATTIKIIPTYESKNNVQHYSIIFQNILFIDKNHKTHNSEIIYHDCTLSHQYSYLSFTDEDINKYNIQINKKEIIINKAQSFLYNNQFTFEYHEEKSTTALITIQYPKED